MKPCCAHPGTCRCYVPTRTKMEIQRLRNLTTGILHTEMGHIYEDLEYFTGEPGIMTHMLPRCNDSLVPILKKRNLPWRLFDGKFDQSHVGELDIEPLSKDELAYFWEVYQNLPNPLANIPVIPVIVDQGEQS